MNYRILFCLALLFITACGPDDEDPFLPSPSDYDTDEDIDAPVVDCAAAFDLFSYTSAPAPTDRRIINIDFNDQGIGLATDRDGTLWRLTNDGEDWAALEGVTASDPFRQPHFADNEVVYLATVGGTSEAQIFRSNDGGLSFTELGSDVGGVVLDIHFTDRDNGFALTVEGTGLDNNYFLRATSDGGQTWSTVTLPESGPPSKFITVEGNLAILGPEDILVNVDGEWELRPLPTGEDSCCSGITVFDGDQIGLTINNTGELWKTEDGGRNWTFDSNGYSSVKFIYIGVDGSELMLGARYRVIGGDARSFRGLLSYERLAGARNWEIEKTDGSCGLNSKLTVTNSGRILGVGTELAFLDR